jgi:carboxymethylenebutenolidase
MTHRGRMIELSGAGGFKLGAYHVEAEGARKGGLILIQEIFGVTDHIKDLCDGFAHDGYEVIAPSLYDRIEKGFAVGYGDDGRKRGLEASQTTPVDQATGDVQAAFDLLTSKGPVFITGYCYGGSITYVAACRIKGLAAASSFYGRLIPDYLNEKPKCPLIMHFGETDASIPLENVRKVQAARPEAHVYLYDAGHGFCSDRPTHHNAKACALARARTLDHFAHHST